MKFAMPFAFLSSSNICSIYFPSTSFIFLTPRMVPGNKSFYYLKFLLIVGLTLFGGIRTKQNLNFPKDPAPIVILNLF